MAKPHRLLTPRERELRTLAHGLKKVRERIALVEERALEDGEVSQSLLLAEAVDLTFRAEADLQSVRRSIHERVRKS